MAPFLWSTRLFIISVCLLALAACNVGKLASAQENKPLTSAQLIALVAGESLPESIAQDIRARGLAFKPCQGFRTMLTDAGAEY